MVGGTKPYSMMFFAQPLSHLVVTRYTVHIDSYDATISILLYFNQVVINTREFTYALGRESEVFCTWRSSSARVVRVHRTMYGVCDGERCIVIAHMAWVCLSPQVC